MHVHSESFDHHNKDNPKNKHDAVLAIVTGLPETIEQYVDFTMISQAEGLKFGVEHYRRRAPHCNGTLVWQFNDVWPGFSWSVVDHDLVPKAGYHYLSRAYAPVLASFRRDGDTLELWLSNSGRTEVTTTATIAVAAFDGRDHLREDVTATIAPGESRAVWTAAGLELAADRYAWTDSQDACIPVQPAVLRGNQGRSVRRAQARCHGHENRPRQGGTDHHRDRFCLFRARPHPAAGNPVRRQLSRPA